MENQQQPTSAQSQAISSHNMGYMTPSALQMRLETIDKLEAVEQFLSGMRTYTVHNEETGQVTIVKKKVGKRLMNDEGVSHMVNYVGSIINPQVVQGNYNEDWYRQQLESTHKRLAFIITVNKPYWEIDKNSRYSIIGFIMEYVKPYLSRLLDNKERESYAATIRSVESSTMNTGQSWSEKVGIK